jgi:regulator of replication initiation timing
MFPKSVSGTSGKRRKNKGGDMAETDDSELRKRFFLLGKLTNVESDAGNPVQWGQVRVNYLEQHLQELLVDIKKLELENENLSKTVLTLSKSPLLASTQSDEEIYERRRRERMLDEITLSCVRDRIEQLIDADGKQTEPGATTEQRWGRNSRETADQICRGINEYDAAH